MEMLKHSILDHPLPSIVLVMSAKEMLFCLHIKYTRSLERELLLGELLRKAMVLPNNNIHLQYRFLLLDNVASQDPLSVSVAILHQFNILPEVYQVGYTKLFSTGQLLGWMHRKFRANEPLKDFSVGNSCTCLSGQPSLDDQQYYPKSNFGTKSLGKAQRDNHLRKPFASLEAARVEADDFEEESSVVISELFHGFLTIGTLGSDPVIIDPSMPTFAISVENITEKETEVTENELKLINDELEKVPGAEGDGCNDSSGRNSHVSTGRNSYVSTGRSSHGSTITLSGKPLEGTETSHTQWKRFKWEQGILDQNRCRLLGVGALEGRRCILKCGYDILALNNRYRNRS